ncbi:amino acid--tRNA ligase-related protein [Amycolatopsis sp. H20-H5]|uniref:amino acid--tRNA ligase-related protein n=1 Tax=Amycolatopsis sp. H20-H5 TaxID=3046309 RepID=UPI002DBEAE41|nr:amino acid--tRNA ligase-related protein [Amycolatopsis sp. H20-H5]MEC3978041.1 amino acid--tRNA ligase-related protein [Amycolatopsis sp. H20-H5]
MTSLVNSSTGLLPADTSQRYLAILDDPMYACLVRLQDLVSYETARFWRAREVRALHLPVTTGSISSPMGLGSDSLPVQVDMFGVPTYLADSMQFMLEYGCRLAPNGCYYLMPSFRGEKADSTHLSQFFHSEAEIPGTLDDVISVADSYVRYLAAAVLEHLSGEVAELAGEVAHIESFLATPTARMTFDEAVDVLDANTACFEVHDQWRTITRLGESKLIEGYGPGVWLSHFDQLSVPFYQAVDETGTKALNADLLLGPGEVVGCGERHTSAENVRAALCGHGVAEEDYQWYVDMKDHRALHTSGFGMGVERFLMWVLKRSDIRDLQLVERYNGEITVP